MVCCRNAAELGGQASHKSRHKNNLRCCKNFQRIFWSSPFFAAVSGAFMDDARFWRNLNPSPLRFTAVPNYRLSELRDQVTIPLSQVAAEITGLVSELESLDAQGKVPGNVLTMRIAGATDAIAGLQGFALLLRGKVLGARNGTLEKQWRKNQTMQRIRREREAEENAGPPPKRHRNRHKS